MKKRSTHPLADRENVPPAARTFGQQNVEGSFRIGKLKTGIRRFSELRYTLTERSCMIELLMHQDLSEVSRKTSFPESRFSRLIPVRG